MASARPRKPRRRRLAVGLAVLVAVTAVTALAASNVRSRDQAAADRAPPPRSVLTATVEERVLTDTLVTRATVTTEATVDVPVPDLPAGSRPTITGAPASPGAELAEGAVAFEVAGRPVLVLVGTVPVYRALVPGATGADVAQLQAALDRLGYPTSRDDPGTYGRATADAVGALYEDRGYVAIAHEVGDRAEAEATLAAARAELDGSEAAQGRVDTAAAALAAIEAGSGPSVAFGEVVYVPALPVRLGAAPATGTTASDTLGSLRAGRIRLEARLGVVEADAVAVGQVATAHDDTTGTAIATTVASVGPPETDPDTGQSFRRAILEPTDTADTTGPAEPTGTTSTTGTAAVDPVLLGRDLRLTIEGSSTETPVLVVPLAAVTNGPDGGPRVERPDGTSVPVTVGQSADGYIEVEPTSGDLEAGDEVVVGR